MARRDEQRGGGRNRNAEDERDSEIVEKLVHINRVAATVKGGHRFSFAALMVVGSAPGGQGCCRWQSIWRKAGTAAFFPTLR